MVEDTEKGGRPDVVTDTDVLNLLNQCEDPVMSSSELADKTRIGDTGMYKKLKKMEDVGLVDSKKIGRSLAWWMTKSGREYLQEELDK